MANLLFKSLGCRIWDTNGQEYIDFSTNGVGACSLGYCNSYVDSAVIDIISKGVMSTLNTPLEVLLAERLLDLMYLFLEGGGLEFNGGFNE